MPSYFKVFTKFWGDPDMDRCSDDAKLLALYLLTGPHRRSEGLFRLPKLYICSDLGWTLERLAEPFRELLGEPFGEPGFMAYDEQAQVVLIRKALKYQPPENDNQVVACIRQLEDLPDTPLTSEFRRLAERYSERLAKRLPEGFGKPLPDPLTPTPAPTQKINPIVEQARPADPITDVFGAWKDSTGKARAQLDDKRRRKIKAALRSYPITDVLDAVRGWQHSPHHRGENEQGTVYNELTLLLRDAEHIERFRDLWRAGPNATPGKATLRMVRTAQSMRVWAEQMEGGGSDGTDRMGSSRPTAQRELPGPAG
jgi:hypothetical protein